MNLRWFSGLAPCVAVAAMLAAAQAPSAAEAATPAVAAGQSSPLNGFWNIDEPARRQTLASVRAELTPAGQAVQRANQEAQAARVARGLVVGLGSFTCGLIGVPFVVGTSEPWLLVVNDDLVMQITERRMMTPRYFYTDGRSWPDLNRMPPSSNGYSIAHWEGPELVIETRGLSKTVTGGVQGGGLKGPNTVLTERVSVSADGSTLMWNYTWVDPELYAKPLTYSIKYDRAAEHTRALVYECDPNDNPGLTVETPAEEGTAR